VARNDIGRAISLPRPKPSSPREHRAGQLGPGRLRRLARRTGAGSGRRIVNFVGEQRWEALLIDTGRKTARRWSIGSHRDEVVYLCRRRPRRPCGRGARGALGPTEIRVAAPSRARLVRRSLRRLPRSRRDWRHLPRASPATGRLPSTVGVRPAFIPPNEIKMPESSCTNDGSSRKMIGKIPRDHARKYASTQPLREPCPTRRHGNVHRLQ